MRILIIEDNPSKYDMTKKAIEEVAPQAEVFWETYAKDACVRLNMKEYDYAIIGMQVPMKVGVYPNPTAGIYILEELTEHDISMNKDIKFCISSSGRDGKGIMESYGFEEFQFIHNVSVVNIRESLRIFLGV